MTTEEKAALNRRVATALGTTVALKELFRFSGQPKRTAYCLRQQFLIGSWCEDLFGEEDYAWTKVFNYCGDARYADLVRQEIERMGWEWGTGICREKANGSHMAFVGNIDAFAMSPHEALCLAFLDAVDAEKEQKP